MAYTFVLSDNNMNSNGFKVLTEGIQLEDFLNNPIMLYEHDATKPIGIWDNVRLEKDILYADAVFDADDDFAIKIQKKVEKGYLKGASIGLIPEEWQEIDGIMVLTKSNLKEASIVSIPANANALKLYDMNGEPLTSNDLMQIKLQLNKKPTTMKKMNVMLNLSVLMALGLNENADSEDVEKNIKKIIDENNQLKHKQIETLVDRAISEGKIVLKEREEYIQLGLKDLDLLRKIVENKKTLPKPIQWIKSEKKLAEREHWTLSDWKKKDLEGLKKLKEEQPEKYLELIRMSGIHKHLINN